MALTVIGYAPVGVDELVEMVIVLVHVGTHWDGANDALASDGRPDASNVTAVDVPDTRVAVTEAVTESPAITVPDVGFTEIGRASCRERVKISAVAVSFKKKMPLTLMEYVPLVV